MQTSPLSRVTYRLASSFEEGTKVMKDFKAFILRGNVIDLAVGVIIGAAFSAIVNSLVQDILTPLLGFVGSPDFSNLNFPAGKDSVEYGKFLNAVISFLLISGAVFFLIVRPVNHLMNRKKTEPDVESTTRECPECLSSVPRRARRCAFCTSELEPAA